MFNYIPTKLTVVDYLIELLCENVCIINLCPFNTTFFPLILFNKNPSDWAFLGM